MLRREEQQESLVVCLDDSVFNFPYGGFCSAGGALDQAGCAGFHSGGVRDLLIPGF